MKDLLSQDEIDALLHGVDEGVVDEEDIDGEFADVDVYDLTSGVHRVQGWIRDIEIIDERIQRNLSSSLLGILHKTTDVKRAEVRISKWGEHVKTLYVPTSINAFALSDIPGKATIVMDATLVYSLVNTFFGGGARPISIEGREFTRTEQRVIQLILGTIVEAITGSWKQIEDVEWFPLESEMNPAATSAYIATDVLVISPFKVSFEGGGGEIQILMPRVMIEAIFHRKSATSAKDLEIWQQQLRQRALNFIVDVTGELDGGSISLLKLFELNKGDIIDIDSPEELSVRINGVDKYIGQMGEHSGKIGVRILREQRPQ